MSATNFTPIQLYRSTTALAVPLAANLAAGELALNIVDGKLYYNDSGTVKLLASNASTTVVNTISFGTTGLTPSTATSGAVTVAGTLVLETAVQDSPQSPQGAFCLVLVRQPLETPQTSSGTLQTTVLV
jgi:hypothetical protein